MMGAIDIKSSLEARTIGLQMIRMSIARIRENLNYTDTLLNIVRLRTEH